MPLAIDLPKDVLAKGAAHVPDELIVMLDEELKAAQEQQRAVYEAQVASQSSAAATRAGVAPDWKPPQHPEEAGYLADGDLSMYSDEMLQRRMGLQQHPGIIQAIEAWWAWLPKDKVQVQIPLSAEEQAASEHPSTPQRDAARRTGSTSSAPSPTSRSRTSTPPPATPQTKVVVGLVKPAYMALVVVIQLLLLPRYGLEPDPAYDPEDDWLEDIKGDGQDQDQECISVEGAPEVLTYRKFFKAMFQLADMWVDGVVAWDYARLLADLLQDVQLHERDSFLLSRVMQRYGYEPYYPEWMAEGPQFVPPKALGDVDEGAEKAWEESQEAEEQQRYEATEGQEGEVAEEEEEEEEEDEGQSQEQGKPKLKPERNTAPPRPAVSSASSSSLTTRPGHSTEPTATWAPVSRGRTPTTSAPHPASGQGSPSAWTPSRKAKILAQPRAQSFSLVSKLLSNMHNPTPVSAAQLAAAADQPRHQVLSPKSRQRTLTGLKSLRMRFDKGNDRQPHTFHVPSRPFKGSMYRAPKVSPGVRYRSPPGTRKAFPVPSPPAVPSDLYHVLPRYHTYSDQLPDRFPRPLTAPEASLTASSLQGPPLSPHPRAPQGHGPALAGHNPGQTLGSDEGRPSEHDLQPGTLPLLPLPWGHRPPRLSTTQLELVLPATRCSAGVGVRASCTATPFASPCSSPALQRREGQQHGQAQGLSQATTTASSQQPPMEEGALGAILADGSSENAPQATHRAFVAAAPAAQSLSEWPFSPSQAQLSPQLAPAHLLPSTLRDSWSEGGGLLGPCQADMAARHLMWSRVGRSASKPPSLSPVASSVVASRSTAHDPQAQKQQGSSCQYASAAASHAEGSAPDSMGILALHHPQDDVLKPWTPVTNHRAQPWTPAMNSSADSLSSRARSVPQPRLRQSARGDVLRSLTQTAAALPFIQRVSPGLPRFYRNQAPPNKDTLTQTLPHAAKPA